MAEVRFVDVTKTFETPGSRGEKVTAVKSLNLLIPDKKFVVLVGPSGCGKTTSLRLIAGLEIPTHGDIYIDQRRATRLHPRERGISMVFQDYALYPHMTGYENLAFGLRNLKFPKPEIDKRVRDASQMLGIGHLLERKPRELSGGQRQRVALGRAIVRYPKVFLFDEPLSNLDAKLRVQMRIELAGLQKRLGVTTVYVTHDQVEAMTLGELIVVMNEGVIQQVGTAEQLYQSPANLFVASFIGSPPMNLTEGVLVRENGLRVKVDGLSIRLPERSPARYQEYLDRKVILGIRPEDIHDRWGPQATRGNILSTPVKLVEYLGSEALVYFGFAGRTFVIRTDADTQARMGTSTDMHFDEEKVILFDPETRTVIS